ncbi:MAG TPA: HAMP domain-containing sensor histidine kinase [Flavipsychrobacter sp.]|nr:HAMP domain-containing sensor histidine kinase [Flavipsychrobacter sp.]
MQKRLRILVGTASVSVALIIGLQLFWLVSLFKEQKQHFITDTRNALMESVVAGSMNVMVMDEPDSVNKALTESIRESMLSGNKANLEKQLKTLSQKHLSAKGTYIDTATEIQRMLDTAKLMLEFSSLTPGIPKEDLQQHKKNLITGFKKRGIDIHFELALLEKKKIKDCTTDSASFNKLFKVYPEQEQTTIFTKQPLQTIVMGFSNINAYILKKMLWLIVLSVIFIPLFVYSYVYVLRTFFRQKKMAEIRNDFINNMTHELKTPISGASVAIELLGNSSIPQDKKDEYIQIAQNELKRLNSLVEKVLSMAAFEKNEITMSASQIPLQSFVQDIINNLKPLLEQNNAKVHLEVSPTDLTVKADCFHLANVIINLIDNAVKYNDKTTPLIDIQISRQGDDVMILVTDNGKGIPSEYTDKIFDKFFRVPAGDLHEVKGYGLGLSYVKAIVTLHKGSIMANSQQGIGSTFIISLPQTT